MIDDSTTLTGGGGPGGEIALDGFNFQFWDGLIRLPAWLRYPGFEGVLFEGTEDLEARFFAPHAPEQHFLQRYQHKSGALQPSHVKEVFERFREFEVRYPNKARSHSLVTPALPNTLRWLERDTKRVRSARPFYAPFTTIQAASDARLLADLIAEFGEPLGPFVFECVEIESHTLPDRDHAIAAFSTALTQSFPLLDASQRRVTSAFEALCIIAQTSLKEDREKRMLQRLALFDLLENRLDVQLEDRVRLPLRVRSEVGEPNESSIEIDARDFAGNGASYPEPKEWSSRLLRPLEETSAWARRRGYSRIALSGRYRLSTAFALGWAFRSVLGFELEIEGKQKPWATDDRPGPGDSLAWTFAPAQRSHEGTLIAAIGIGPEPEKAVKWALGIASDADLFVANLPGPIPSAASAQASVSAVKKAVARNTASLGAQRIDLYFAGPAGFAVALGHRWNGLPPTQIYEFQSGTYVPTVRLGQ